MFYPSFFNQLLVLSETYCEIICHTLITQVFFIQITHRMNMLVESIILYFTFVPNLDQIVEICLHFTVS